MQRLLMACVLVGAIGSVQAQPEHHPAMDAQQRTTQLQKSLQLSDEQAAKIKNIFENDAQRRQSLMDKYQPQLTAFHAEQKTLHDQTHSQLGAVLTPLQLKKMEQQCEGHKGMHKQMHDGADKADHAHDAPAK